MEAQDRRWARWERTRAKGPVWFVCIYGACGWGLSYGCLMAALAAVGVFSGRPNPPVALAFLAAGPLAGCAFGFLLWLGMESRYQAARATEQARQQQRAAVEALTREVRELREALGRRPEGGEGAT